MPPFSRYWFAYLLAGLASGILVGIGVFLFVFGGAALGGAQPFILYAAGWIALFSLIGSTWSQWKTSTIQHAISTLQALRTDKEYLINAGLVVPLLRRGEPIDAAMVASIRSEQGQPYKVEAPNTGQAVYFILNHHEFLAAAARAGAIDVNLLRQTIRGVVIGLVEVFAPLIRTLRETNPASLRNLVHLYRQFTGTGWADAPDLGPEFPWDTRLNAEPWLARWRRRFGPFIPLARRGHRGRSAAASRRGSGG